MAKDPNGIIERRGKTHIVSVTGPGLSYLEEYYGAKCRNPKDPDEQHTYEKTFRYKTIYMPGEAEAARRVLNFGQPDTIVLGMTGYSNIKKSDLVAWGIQPGAYEAACGELMANMVQSIWQAFPGAHVAIADGASDVGVDLGVVQAATALGVPHLGHSCPFYMFFVNDDDSDAVYVADTIEAYSDQFIDDLNILVSVGGREQAFIHDIHAVFLKRKKYYNINLIRSISTNHGSPPAYGPDGSIQNANAAFEETLRMFQTETELIEPYDELLKWIRRVMTRDVRNMLRPATAFSGWRQNP